MQTVELTYGDDRSRASFAAGSGTGVDRGSGPGQGTRSGARGSVHRGNGSGGSGGGSRGSGASPNDPKRSLAAAGDDAQGATAELLAPMPGQPDRESASAAVDSAEHGDGIAPRAD